MMGRLGKVAEGLGRLMSRRRVALTVLILVVTVSLVARFAFGYPGELLCQWQEAREGSRYINRPARFEDVRVWAEQAGLSLVVVGADAIERPSTDVTAPARDAVVHTRYPKIGEVTSASACRPAGVRKHADVYVRVAVRPDAAK